MRALAMVLSHGPSGTRVPMAQSPPQAAHERSTSSGDEGRRSGSTGGSALLLVAGMVCFGTATPVSAIVGEHVPVWLGSFLRMAVATAVLVPALLLSLRASHGSPGPVQQIRQLDGSDRVRLAAMAAVGTFGFSALMLLGMREIPGAVGSVVMATTPAVTAIGAVALLHDRLGAPQVTALALAVAGVVVVNVSSSATQGGGGSLLLGIALVLGAVCCEATYSLLGKQLTADLSPLAISAASALLATALFLPLAVWDAVGFSWSAPNTGEWIAVLWWGAGTFAIGSWLWFEGMSRTSPGRASTFMAVMPVSALIFSYVLLGESFRWIDALGMGLVLIGLVVVARSGSTVH